MEMCIGITSVLCQCWCHIADQLTRQQDEYDTSVLAVYLLFWEGLEKDNEIKADRALWAFGKFI